MSYVFQDSKQKTKLGNKAPWYVGWNDLNAKPHKKKVGSKTAAQKYARKIASELVAGLCGENRMTWAKFRQEFEQTILPAKRPQTQRCLRESLDLFDRLLKPKRLSGITTGAVDEFRAKLRMQSGKKPGSTMSPATINKHLRHLRVAVRKAHRWGYLPRVPEFEMEREPHKLVRYVSAEHFAMMYRRCDAATLPRDLPYSPADWWRALLVFTYMTGWRVGEPLALMRDDLDLENGTAITRADDNKSNSDELVPLHPIVVKHLRGIASFRPEVFPWFYAESTTLWNQYHKIQRAAGIKLPCHGKHEHTPACHVYGFHDLRRAFATMNAARLSADSLQALMRHKSYLTTKRYINMARRLDDAVDQLHVPTLPNISSS